MIKGCRKNVVWVRNTGSEMFEEAFFVLSDKGVKGRVSETDMVKAAGRIVAESPVASYFNGAQSEGCGNKARAMAKALWFMLGAAVMAALNAILVVML